MGGGKNMDLPRSTNRAEQDCYVPNPASFPAREHPLDQ
jgi:hypothetical protein